MPSRQRGHGRVGRPWLRLTAEVRARRDPCWLCGHPIDYTLRADQAMSFTVDHVVALSVDPTLAHDLSNLRAAHRRCNSSKKDKTGRRAARTSRAW